jgi:hypothetical protein
MQKWEYAYIDRPFTWKPSELSLIVLHPSGPERVEKEKKLELVPQLNAWITELGQDGYEMTGVTHAVDGGQAYYTYWFKRPIT